MPHGVELCHNVSVSENTKQFVDSFKWNFFLLVINCGDPEIPTNGIVDFTRTTFEAIANYRCVNGYNRIGTERRVCGRLGLWSGRVPRCQSKWKSLQFGGFSLY